FVFAQPELAVADAFAGFELVFVTVPRANEMHIVAERLALIGAVGRALSKLKGMGLRRGGPCGRPRATISAPAFIGEISATGHPSAITFEGDAASPKTEGVLPGWIRR